MIEISKINKQQLDKDINIWVRIIESKSKKVKFIQSEKSTTTYFNY